LPPFSAKRDRSLVFPVIRWRSSALVNLASGNPADHDGGTDHVGGALFALRLSGHQPRSTTDCSVTIIPLM
jgi:hypothetical protein